jgi:hypothetical protein
MAIHEAVDDSQEAQASAHNNLGVFYFEQSQFDSAHHYFQKAHFLLGSSRKEMGLYCAILDNIAQIEMQKDNWSSALRTFLHNDSVYVVRRLHHKYLGNKLRQMMVMSKLQLPNVPVEIEKGLRHIRQFQREIPVRDTKAFFRFAIDYCGVIRDHNREESLQQAFYQWTDSLELARSEQLHLLNRSLLSVQEAGFQNELRVQELAAEKTEVQLRSTRRLLLLSVSAAAVITILLLMYFRKRRQKLYAQKQFAEAELKTKEMEARLIEHELALKKKDLTQVVLYNTQVYDANLKMIERLQSIQKSKEEWAPQIRHLLTELQSQNQIGERSLTLQTEIDSVNAAFYEKLRIRFPGLTKNERELCGYLRINLSTKDISIIKNVEAASVKMGKNRLRKKLGLGPEEDLYGYLRNI